MVNAPSGNGRKWHWVWLDMVMGMVDIGIVNG